MATKAKKTRKNTAADTAIRNTKIRRIAGVAFLLSASYLLVAFVSYLFTWQNDQDLVLNRGWSLIWMSDENIANSLGKLGAIVSHQFFYWMFGLPSFGFVYIFALIGWGLIRNQPLRHRWKHIGKVIFLMAWLSLFLAFVFNRTAFPWGGAFGQQNTQMMAALIGNVGLFLLLLAIIIGGVIWIFNPSFESWRLKWKSSGKDAESLASASADVQSDDYTNSDHGWISIANPYDNEKTTEEEDDDDDDPSNSGFRFADHPEREDTPETESDTYEPKSTEGVEVVEKQEAIGLPMNVTEENKNHTEPYDPTQELSRYQPPGMELLFDYDDQRIVIDREELEANSQLIVSTLEEYKIKVKQGEGGIKATIGPTVTLYEIVPESGIRISTIKNLEDDIALRLSALGIRIIAPMPGRGTIGIEVPNKKKQVVSLKEVLMSDAFQKAKKDLPIALGKTISNEVFVADLAKMPHLLIAGATGQGKSVGINTVIMSLLYKKHPSQVKLVLIDPKKVELFPYSKIENHFLAFMPDEPEPIVTETSRVVNTLQSLCIEMDTRYDLLKKAKARNIKEYNQKFVQRNLNPEKGHKFLPFIVLVIDEFADLIMTAGKEVELPIARLAQLARAVGIHLIIATQRPSVNIITGVIKANFPARIAFKVTSKVDSRTILDGGGADQLIGRGDMLLSVGGDSIRIQCAFVDTPEVEAVIEHIASQQGYPQPFLLPEYVGEESGAGSNQIRFSEVDDLFEDAARLVVQTQQGSTSMLQRRLKLGFNRAGRIIDQLEAFNIVGPSEGSKAREVLISGDMELEHHLEQLRSGA